MNEKALQQQKKISWISIKRINNQHSLFWFKFRKEKSWRKKSSSKREFCRFFFSISAGFGATSPGINDDFLSVLRLTLPFVSACFFLPLPKVRLTLFYIPDYQRRIFFCLSTRFATFVSQKISIRHKQHGNFLLLGWDSRKKAFAFIRISNYCSVYFWSESLRNHLKLINDFLNDRFTAIHLLTRPVSSFFFIENVFWWTMSFLHLLIQHCWVAPCLMIIMDQTVKRSDHLKVLLSFAK